MHGASGLPNALHLLREAEYHTCKGPSKRRMTGPAQVLKDTPACKSQTWWSDYMDHALPGLVPQPVCKRPWSSMVSKDDT